MVGKPPEGNEMGLYSRAGHFTTRGAGMILKTDKVVRYDAGAAAGGGGNGPIQAGIPR
jgi:hypothetical protein